MTIDPAKLAEWPFTHSAGFTGDGTALNGPEFDGLIKAVATDETLHLGWTVLPERSADVSTAGSAKAGSQITLSNGSDGAGRRGAGLRPDRHQPEDAEAGPGLARLAGLEPGRDRPAGGRRP